MVRKETIETLKKFNDEKETTLKLRAELKQVNEALVASKATIQMKSQELDEAHEKIKNLNIDAIGLREQIEEHLKQLDATTERYESLVKALRTEIWEKEQHITGMEGHLEETEWKYQGSLMMIEDYLQYISKGEEDVEALEEELEEKTQELEDLRQYASELSRPASRVDTGSEPSSTRGTDRGHHDGGRDGELSKREKEMVKTLHQLQGQLTNLQAQHQGVMKQVSAQQESLSAQNAAILKYQEEQAKTSGIEMKFKLLKTKFVGLKSNLDSADTKNAALQVELTASKNAVQNLQEELNLFKELQEKSLADQNGDVNEIYQAQISQLEDLLSKRSKESENSASELSTMLLKQVETKQEIEELQALVSNLKEASSNGEKLTAGLEISTKKVSALETDLSKSNEKIAALNLDIKEYIGKTTELDGQKKLLERELTSVNTALETLKQEFALYKESAEKTLAENTPEAIKEMFTERLHALEEMVVEAKRLQEQERDIALAAEGKHISLQASLDQIHHMVDTAEAAKSEAEERVEILQKSEQRLVELEKNYKEVCDLNEKLKTELVEAQDELVIAMKMASSVTSAPSIAGNGGEDSDLFSKEELEAIKEEEKVIPPPLNIPLPQIIQTEIICSVCLEKQDEAKLNESKIDVTQWDFFIPAESSGSRHGKSRKGSKHGHNSSRYMLKTSITFGLSFLSYAYVY